MKALVCLDDPMPTDGSCVSQAWVDFAPSFFTGWTLADVAPVVGALLTAWAVALLFRVLHRWAQSDIN